ILRYDHPELIRVVRRKTESFRAGPDAPAPLLRLAVAHARTVLDVGGAFATDFWRLKDAGLKWAVVEQPGVVAAARGLESEGLGFFATCEDAARWLGDVDLLWSAGALYYLPDPAQALRDWVRVAPRQIGVSRMTWSDVTMREWQWSRLSENGPGPLPAGERDRWVVLRRTLVTREW